MSLSVHNIKFIDYSKFQKSMINAYNTEPSECDEEDEGRKKKKNKINHVGDGMEQLTKLQEEKSRVMPKMTECAIKWQNSMCDTLEATDFNAFSTPFERYYSIVDTLTNHPRSKSVFTKYLPGGKKIYMIKQAVIVNGGYTKIMNVTYEGLTSRQRSVFHPDTTDNPIEKSKRNKALGGRKPLNKDLFNDGNGRPCSKVGAEHGTMVHNQFEKITKIMTKAGSLDYYQKENVDVDPCVENFVKDCIRKKWYPVKSEFIVFDEALKVCTAIDMLLVDTKTWELIAVEFKTGFEYEEYGIHPNDMKFPPPLNKLTNFPLNRHFLQLTAMLIILEKKYQTNITKGYVVRMCPKAGIIESYEAPKWTQMSKYRNIIYNALKKYAVERGL